MKVLFVVPPLTGHVRPTVALGAELSRRGHQVAWSGDPAQLRSLLGPEARVLAAGEGLAPSVVAGVEQRSAGLRGAAALAFLWSEFLLPLAQAMEAGVERAVERFGPDMVVVDQQAFAGAVVARRRGLLWVTSATTSAELVDPFAGLPRVGEWVRDGLAQLAAGAGIDPGADLRFSEHLVLAYSTEALTGPTTLPPGSGPLVMVGPCLPADPGGPLVGPSAALASFLRDGPAGLLVTLGTVSGGSGGRFFATCCQALADRPVRAVLVAPRGGLSGSCVPPNVVVQPWIDQLEVLAHVDAVVCHGGHNTVCEALARGLPLVVAPIRDDQPVIAAKVTQAGAGRRVSYGRVGPAELGSAIDAALGDPALRRAARAIGRSFAEAGGTPRAADALEALGRPGASDRGG